ncbi:hypothetical protein GGI35DRAFT_464631 [Trichoderma velutinum]
MLVITYAPLLTMTLFVAPDQSVSANLVGCVYPYIRGPAPDFALDKKRSFIINTTSIQHMTPNLHIRTIRLQATSNHAAPSWHGSSVNARVVWLTT